MTYSPNTTSGHSLRRALAWSSVASMLALTTLSGCSSVRPEPTVRTVATEVVRPDPTPPLPDPRPLDLLEVDWRVVTPETLPEGEGWSLIALDPQQYQNLSTNMAELLRYVREAKWLLRYYRGEVAPAQ